jgi:MFS family permease
MELVWIVAGGAGPALGGAFTEKLSWRWNFWINVPVAGLTFLLLFFYLDVHNPRTPILVGLKAIDWFGSLSITGLAIMVLLGLQFGGSAFAWNSPEVICLIIFGSLMSLFFVYSEKRLAQYPIMPLALFTNWSNAASLLLTLWHGMVSLKHPKDKNLPLAHPYRFTSAPSTICLYISNPPEALHRLNLAC